MPPQRETKLSSTFLLNSTDLSGRPIDPTVLAAAQRLGSQASAYAERWHFDPALAANFLEEAAATVSETITRKRIRQQAPVRDLPAYLFKSFKHMVNGERRKEATRERALLARARSSAASSDLNPTEIKLIVDKIMARYGKLTQQLILIHSVGISWEDVGARCGISAHAAEERFYRALEQARRILGISKNKG